MSIYKPKPISGFPEWLPETRRAEQLWFDKIRKTFESYGFCSIETPSVEEMNVINAKGGDGAADVDKEVYVLERLHKQEAGKVEDLTGIKKQSGDKEARLALHFDQTIPLARYTAQHFNDLVFPFKRYQMQRVWRGERPQAGRFREFYQCDIDVINVDNLPLHFDAEMPAIIWEILSNLDGMEDENIQIRISNRKILMGLLQGFGIKNITEVTRWIDKLDKDQTLAEVEIMKAISSDKNSLSEKDDILTREIINICKLNFTNSDDLEDKLVNNSKIDTSNSMLKEGIEELSFVMEQLSHLPKGAVVADLSIVRGLDYYTGTVYETVFTDDPSYGSICSGGRYDDLASNYINKKLPGVGISIGFSRLFDRIRLKGNLPSFGMSPADMLITLPSEELRTMIMKTAQILRARGFNVETFHSPSKMKRQLAYAQKKGIKYVWFPEQQEVKNMGSGEQVAANPNDWKKDD